MVGEEKNSTAVEETKTAAVPQEFEEAEDKIKSESMAESQSESGEQEIPEKQELSGETPESMADIDPEVVEACRDYGWDDEKIAQIAETMPEFFDYVREVIDEENAPVQQTLEQKPSVEKPALKTIDEINFNLDPDIVGTDVKNAIDKIASILNEQRKGLTDEKSQLQSERDSTFNMRIDSFFDKAGLSELGKMESLTRRQYGLRSELFAHANVTAQLRGIPIERALNIEIEKYKNQGNPKQAEQKVLDKLEKQKRTITNRPTRRLSEGGRKFADEADRIETVMREAEETAGLV